ncbi:tetratricopeptide repeat protein [bacterium]|nr:tetratricopeptide repeat protein [bacterium]
MNTVPAHIGPYRIIEKLGQGGMGVVYRAVHQDSGQAIALKTVLGLQKNLLQDLRREISILSRLDHPGIVKIVDFDDSESFPWYAMELIEGVSLRSLYSNLRGTDSGQVSSRENVSTRPQVITVTQAESQTDRNGACSHKNTEFSTLIAREHWESGEKSDSGSNRTVEHLHTPAIVPLSDEKQRAILTLFRRLCVPLAYLHGQGIVYRDLKPENILIQKDGLPIIIDFGLISHFGGVMNREILHIIASTAGTIHYMAPEQIRGEYVDARADLYSLGIMIYEFLTGFFPFTGATLSEIIASHLHDYPPHLSEFAPFLSQELSTLIHRLLAKKPGDRIGYAETVASILGNCGAGNGMAAGPTRSRSYLYRPGFVGRHNDLNALKQDMRSLLSGSGKLVLFEGESGIGKTRLAMEFGRKVAQKGGIVLTGMCYEADVRSLQALSKPFIEIADLCREQGPEFTEKLFGHRLAVMATHIPELAGIPGWKSCDRPSELPAQQAQLRLYSYIVETLQNLSQQNPLLMILDDLHWADDTSLGFIDFVLRSGSLRTHSILILGICRSEEENSSIASWRNYSDVRVIEIERMSDVNIADLIKDMLALDSAPAAFCDFLVSHSGGNPLYVAEYLNTMVDNQLLIRDERGDWHFQAGEQDQSETGLATILSEKFPIPGPIQDLIHRRLSRLDEDAVRVLRIAATLGQETDIDLVRMVKPVSDRIFWTVLNDLYQRQILEQVTPERLRFGHNTIRQAVYDMITAPERATLHHSIALSMESYYSDRLQEYLGALAFHWLRAGDPERARKYFIEAAEHALRNYRYGEVLEYSRAAQEIEHDNRAGKLMADALCGLSRYEETLAVVREIEASPAATPLEIIEARLLAAWVYEGTGDYEKCLQLVQLILDSECPDLIRKETLRLQGVITYFLGDYERALVILRGLMNELEQKDRADMSEQEVRLYLSVIANIGIILDFSGHSEESLRLQNMALEICRHHGFQSAIGSLYVNLGNLYFRLGKFETAYSYYLQSKEIHYTIGYRRGFASSLNSMGVVKFRLGDYREALRLREEALLIFRAIGDQIGELTVLNNMGITLYFLGEYDKADEVLNQCLGLTELTGDKNGQAIVLKNLGTLYKSQDNPERALENVNAALALFRESGAQKHIAESWLALASNYSHLSRHSEADYSFQQCLELLQSGDMKDLLADMYLERARSRLERYLEGAGQDLDQAKIIASEMDYDHLGPALISLEARIESSRAHHDRALALMSSLRGFMDTTQDFQMLLRIYLDLAHIYLAAGNIEEAENTAREGVRRAEEKKSYAALREFQAFLKLDRTSGK